MATFDAVQVILDALARMEEAAIVTPVDMLTALLSDPSISAARSLEEEIDMQVVFLKVYGERIYGRPTAWMDTPGFLAAYAEAARKVGREELVKAWDDARDSPPIPYKHG
ncbi:hypothetical protein [Pseudomonas sp. NY15354]|uniref:hypothetical protein n=1 Tax=Pseudomonas sp. NY15354 TaxID=3400351 RepID=UPI003A884BF6